MSGSITKDINISSEVSYDSSESSFYLKKSNARCDIISIDGLKRKLKITLKNSYIFDLYKKDLQEIIPTYEMHGFRKGKIPFDVLHRSKGKYFFEKAIKEHVNLSISECIDVLNATNDVKIDKLDYSMKDDLVIDIQLELKTSIPDIEPSKLSVVKKKVEVTEDFIEEVIDKYYSYFSVDDKENSYPVEGDLVLVDYSIYFNNKKLAKSSFSNVRLKLGSQKQIIGLEDYIKQKKIGDSFDVYHENTKFEGVVITYKVILNDIMKYDKDAYKNSFYGKIDLPKVIEDLKDKYQKKIDFLCTQECRKDILKEIDKNYNFDIPSNVLKKQDSVLDKKDSVFRVKMSMIINDFANKNNIIVTDEEIQNNLKDYIDDDPSLLDVIYYSKNKINYDAFKRMKSIVGAIIIENKVLDFIISKSNISYKDVSFSDFKDSNKESFF